MLNKRKAAALKYDKGYEAPVVTASGVGVIADNIISKANENKIPIVENKELADLLTNVEIGNAVPYELYEAVAQVIAFVTDIDKLIDRR